MNALNKRLVLTYLLGLALSNTVLAVEANSEPATSPLQLMAIVDGKPAFKPTIWRIRCRSLSRYYNKTVNRHAAVVDLKPGNCIVNISMQDKLRTYRIVIEKDKKHSLVASFN